MEGTRAINDADIQRASVLSNQKFSSKKDIHLIEPKDPYYMVHLIFFFFGIVSFLSVSFFITANDFWMYKLRDVSEATYNSTNKTTLQTYFASATSITQSIPGTLMSFFVAFLGHKINIRWRIMGSLVTIFCIYAILAIFVTIDTDSWQLGFFIFVLVLYVIMTIANLIFIMVGVTLISKFPPQFMKIQLYGQGAAGVISSLLQIISLSIGHDTQSSALIYFNSGVVIVFLTLILGYTSNSSAKFRFYLGDTEAATEKPVHTAADIKRVAKKIWLVLCVTNTTLLAMGMGHTNITNLIVSEDYGKGYAWNDKYFVPVATFLNHEVFGLLGRWLAKPFIQEKHTVIILIVHVIRLCVGGPVDMFCNARPRRHLPVLFPHDWEYITIVAVNITLGTWFFTSVMLSLRNLVDNDDVELGFLIVSMSQSIFYALNTLLGPLFVSLL